MYRVLLDEIPEHMLGNTFGISDLKYQWMSIEEMENNQEIMEKNDDIVAFVKTKCS